MPVNTQIVARVRVDRRFSGDIICELRGRFPKYDKYERLTGNDEEDVIHVLEFTIDEKDTTAFFDHHHNLGQHRGELVFYRPLKIPEPVSA